MKITDIKTFPVDCFRTNWVFVKVYTDEALQYENGYIRVPDKPGFGIELDEEKCLEHPYQPPYSAALYRRVNRYPTGRNGILFLNGGFIYAKI